MCLQLAVLAAAYAGPKPSSTLVVQPAEAAFLWADHGSGSAHDATVFSTRVPSGWFAVADYAQVGYNDAGTYTNWQPPYGPPIALRSDGDEQLLAKPTGWTMIFAATATKPFSLWRPEPPAGFVALGEVGTTDGKPPPAGAPYAVVAERCVARCDADALLWADKDGGVALLGARGNASHVSTGGLIADLSYTAMATAEAAQPQPTGVAGVQAGEYDLRLSNPG